MGWTGLVAIGIDRKGERWQIWLGKNLHSLLANRLHMEAQWEGEDNNKLEWEVTGIMKTLPKYRGAGGGNQLRAREDETILWPTWLRWWHLRDGTSSNGNNQSLLLYLGNT